MADSQNTYQNDVKIKSGIGFSTIVYAILAIVIIGFGGYNLYIAEIDKAYNSGYETAKVEEYNKGLKKGREEGRRSGYNEGYYVGYNDGYNQGKEDSKSSSKGSSKSSSSSNNYSGDSYVSNNYSSNDEKEYSYILNKNTGKFHYSWCNSVNQMKEKNKLYFDGTRTEAINKGYSPCKNCNP
ncbi:MAG: hypothetical protein IJ283_01020 [Oscillospiraceae bacterium]|nr:hypothetical protein [Oscillospiraceae bacterium]